MDNEEKTRKTKAEAVAMSIEDFFKELIWLDVVKADVFDGKGRFAPRDFIDQGNRVNRSRAELIKVLSENVTGETLTEATASWFRNNPPQLPLGKNPGK